jgi:hypothetical protein
MNVDHPGKQTLKGLDLAQKMPKLPGKAEAKTAGVLFAVACLAMMGPIRTDVRRTLNGEETPIPIRTGPAVTTTPAQTPPPQPQPIEQPVEPSTTARSEWEEEMQDRERDGQRVRPKRKGEGWGKDTKVPSMHSQQKGVKSNGPWMHGVA